MPQSLRPSQSHRRRIWVPAAAAAVLVATSVMDHRSHAPRRRSTGGGPHPRPRGGGNGWVVLNQHDADGAAGVNGDMNRWYCGMVHEMGHALGQPDSTYTDGTPLSASFSSSPNCHFDQTQKQRLLNGHRGSFP